MPTKSTTKRKTSSKKTTKARTTKRKGTGTLTIILVAVLVIFIGAGLYIGIDTDRREAFLEWMGIKPYKEKRVYGIDISRYQEDIKWDRLHFYYDKKRDTITFEKTGEALPVNFVFIKATQGRAVDKSYEKNREEARKNGFRTGAYHLFVNDTNIEAQAENFVTTAQLDSLDFPPILDVETKMVERPYSKVRERVMKWLKIVEDKTGGKPLIYCSDKIREELFDTPEFNTYHFWIARYDTTPPRSKDDWLFWQFTEKGKMHGLKGKVDISIWKGSKSELEEWRKSCWHNTKLREEIENELDGAIDLMNPADTTKEDTTIKLTDI